MSCNKNECVEAGECQQPDDCDGAQHAVNDAKPHIFQAYRDLAALQGGVQNVKADKEGQYNNKYATIDAVLDHVREKFQEHNFCHVIEYYPSDTHCHIGLTLIHVTTGLHISFGSFQMPLHKQDAQAYKSATTYARRILYLTALGIDDHTDDDGASASNVQGRQPSQVKQQGSRNTQPSSGTTRTPNY